MDRSLPAAKGSISKGEVGEPDSVAEDRRAHLDGHRTVERGAVDHERVVLAALAREVDRRLLEDGQQVAVDHSAQQLRR